MKEKKKSLVIHPFLFAIFPIIFLFSVNVNSIFPEEIILPLFLVIGVTFLIWIALGFLLKSRIKSGFIVSIGLVLFFSYGHIYILLDDLQTVDSAKYGSMDRTPVVASESVVFTRNLFCSR